MTRFSVILFIGLALTAGARADAHERHRIRVTASPRQVDRVWKLDVRVSNEGSDAIVLSAESLPWLCPKRLLVLAEAYRPRHVSEPLTNEPANVGSECPAGTLEVAAGTSASGLIELRHFVRGLDEASRSSDVVLFWFWRFRIEGQPEDENHGGYEIIRTGSQTGQGAKTTIATGIPSVIVEAQPMDESEPLSLGFVLRNDGTDTISIAFTELPWLTRFGIILRAAALDPPQSIDELGTIRDVRGPTAWLTLPPSSFMTGEIPLHKRFGALDEVRDSHDVVVFWFYSARSTDGSEIGPRGGFVMLPARR